MKFIRIIYCVVLCFLLNSCVEEIEFELDNFENYLVVEAGITNELKHQQVRLTRTYDLDETIENNVEQNARVQIVTGNGEVFEFRESQDGIYESEIEFQAVPGVSYQLIIVTTTGEEYISSPEELLPASTIEDVEVERRVLDGEDGLVISVNTSGAATDSDYYRFEYEETYQIVSRYRYGSDLEYDAARDTIPYEVFKDYEEHICYNTSLSNELILGSTTDLSDNNLQNKLVHFIPVRDPKISFRYSILVKQYSLSQAHYNYLRTLQEMSLSNNLFSQTQPGFLNGNIESSDGQQEAIGLFTVSSVSTKRRFFDFDDYHTTADTRTYFATDCRITTVDLFNPVALEALISQVVAGEVKLVGIIPSGVPGIVNYEVTTPSCVDCRYWGDLEPPEFWED